MKYNTAVSSSRRINRKAHFNADRHVRAACMVSRLSKDLKNEHKVKSMPIRVGDTVKVIKGSEKVEVEGKVTKVDRIQYRIYVEGANQKARSNENDKPKEVSISPNNCMITKLVLNGSRHKILSERAKKE